MTTATTQLDDALARASREGWRHWVRDVQDEAALLEGCWFDQAAADRARKFFETFVVIHDKRTKRKAPFKLLDWQWERVVGPLFGWMRADGTRRFRHVFCSVAKKNGKTELSAGLALYFLIADGEPEPEVYGVAVSVGQVKKTLWKSLSNMHANSPQIKRMVEIKQGSEPRLVCQRNRGFFAVLANKAGTADGINPHALVYDEVHRWSGSELYDALMYGDSARSQPVQVVITTAGNDRDSIGFELHDRAEKVATGKVIDTETLVYIASADINDDPSDPAIWRKANPSLGVTLPESKIATDYERAKDSPARMLNFRRLRLNQWVGRVSAWLDYDRWLKCAADIDPTDYEGRDCWAGLDLSGTGDITALALVFPNADGTRDVLPYFWVPEDTLLDHEKQSGMPYRAWAEAGLIETTPGDYIDFDYVRKRIIELHERFNITELAYDPTFCQQLATQLEDHGIAVFPFWQRRTMTHPALRHMEYLTLEQRLRHPNHPVLNWMAGNVEVDENADGFIKTRKPKDSRKIDGIDAISFALGNDIKEKDTSTENYWEESPLIVIGGRGD